MLRDNGRVKIITGIRRCGKSYLLNTLYKNYLIEDGVKEENILHKANKKNNLCQKTIHY